MAPRPFGHKNQPQTSNVDPAKLLVRTVVALSSVGWPYVILAVRFLPPKMISRQLAVAYGIGAVFIAVALLTDTGRESVVQLGRRLSEEHAQHKDLFPMDASDYWGTISVVLGLLVAASGGIGGGGILVPLLILIYGFAPKYAVPLSNFTIVGSSITNMVLNIPKRHPDADRPLVDWDLILVMEPLTMAGAVSSACF
jgi:hypothetical protein